MFKLTTHFQHHDIWKFFWCLVLHTTYIETKWNGSKILIGYKKVKHIDLLSNHDYETYSITYLDLSFYMTRTYSLVYKMSFLTPEYLKIFWCIASETKLNECIKIFLYIDLLSNHNHEYIWRRSKFLWIFRQTQV